MLLSKTEGTRHSRAIALLRKNADKLHGNRPVLELARRMAAMTARDLLGRPVTVQPFDFGRPPRNNEPYGDRVWV